MSSHRRISVLAVLAGLLFNMFSNVGTNLGLYLFMAANKVPIQEIIPRMHSFSGLLLSAVYGLGYTVLSCYIAGRIAKRSEILHGAIVGIASIPFGFVCWESDNPFWYMIVYYGGMLPAGLAGGYCAARYRRPAAGSAPGSAR